MKSHMMSKTKFTTIDSIYKLGWHEHAHICNIHVLQKANNITIIIKHQQEDILLVLQLTT